MCVSFSESIDFNKLLQLQYECSGLKSDINKLKEKVQAYIIYSMANETRSISLYKQTKLCGFLILHINNSCNFLGKKVAYFSYILCIKDNMAFSHLIDHTEKIAFELNCTKLVGPIHDSILIERGIPNFDGLDIPFGMSKVPLYLLSFLIERDYSLEQNLVELLCTKDSNLIRRLTIANWLKKRFSNIVFKAVKNEEINNYNESIKNLYNDAWKNNWGFREITLKEIEAACISYEHQENIAILALSDGKLIGIAMAAKDIDLSREHDSFWRAYFIGVCDSYRKSGLSVYIFSQLASYVIEELSASKFSCGWMLESNNNVLSLIRKLLISVDSTERIYSIMSKDINN